MIEHPGSELQVLIKEKGLTQKAFAFILGKKVSEVNELLKGKRNITIQRDYLLHQTLGTPIKYWILKQIDYDYSLIDIDEKNINNNPGSTSMTDLDGNKEQNENGVEPKLNGMEDAQNSQNSERDISNNPGSTSTTNQDGNKEQNTNGAEPGLNGVEDVQETPLQEPDPKDDEDFKKRARIFKSF